MPDEPLTLEPLQRDLLLPELDAFLAAKQVDRHVLVPVDVQVTSATVPSPQWTVG